MYTQACLLDIHSRSHRSLIKLIDHCDAFMLDELNHHFDGFGFPSIMLQFQHIVGAEEYWVGVLHEEILVDERDDDIRSMLALRAYRQRIHDKTLAYLTRTSDAELTTPVMLNIWGGRTKLLMPARILMRTQTHFFQHMGQVSAQCRLLGRPIPAGLDFTVLDESEL